jgi:hypothetical protein
MTADLFILNYKLNGIITMFAERQGIPLREALNVFYRSRLYTEVREGLSDMHCRSDEYLAEELRREQDELSHG